MITSTVYTPRGRFGIHTDGSGPVVLMIPPIGRSGIDYSELAGTLAKQGYKTIAIDPKGVGQSDSVDGPATLDDLAKDAVAILDSLAISNAHLIGYAMGNRVARRIAVSNPDRVLSVTLLAAGGQVPVPEWAGEALTRIYDPNVSETQRIQDLRATCFSSSFNGAIEQTGWLDGWWPEAARSQRAGARSASVDSWWGAGTAPILAIQGLDDVFAPPANGRALKEAFPDRVTLVELEDTGHAILSERPEQVSSALLRFLRSPSD